jgi:hypothetical protein
VEERDEIEGGETEFVTETSEIKVMQWRGGGGAVDLQNTRAHQHTIVVYSAHLAHLAQDRDRWRALVNTVMSLRVP